jgi:hypothetical protein
MIGGPKRLLKVRRTILPNLQQAIRKTTAAFTTQPVKALTNGLCDGTGQSLAGELRQFFHQPVGFVVLDIQAHLYTFLQSIYGNLPTRLGGRKASLILGYVILSSSGSSAESTPQFFFDCRFRSRTPGPPPFSSMNSTDFLQGLRRDQIGFKKENA